MRYLYQSLRLWAITGFCLLSISPLVVPATLSGSPPPALAQNAFQRLWNRFFSRPSRDERPATVGRGGANRDRCPYSDEELTALVPVSEETGLPYLEKTVSERPTWYFYVPYRPRSGREVEFTLLDDSETIQYQETFPLSDTPGLLSVTLPEQVPGLSLGEAYRWVFAVICNPANRSGDAAVNGWVERVSSNSVLSQTALSDLSSMAPFERVGLYAENLIWLNAVDELLQSKELDSSNSGLSDARQSLFEVLGLENLAEPPRDLNLSSTPLE